MVHLWVEFADALVGGKSCTAGRAALPGIILIGKDHVFMGYTVNIGV